MHDYLNTLFVTCLNLFASFSLYRVVIGDVLYKAIGNTLGWDLLLFLPLFVILLATLDFELANLTNGWFRPSSFLFGFVIGSLLYKSHRNWMKNKFQQLSEGNFFTD